MHRVVAGCDGRTRVLYVVAGQAYVALASEFVDSIHEIVAP